MKAMSKLPRAVRNQTMCVKLVFMCLYGLLLWLVYSLPSPMLWTQSGAVEPEYLSLLLFASLASLISFFVVQGSNPGYIEIAGDGEDADIGAVEMSSLLAAAAAEERGDGRGVGGEEERKPIPVSSGLIPNDSVHADAQGRPSRAAASSSTTSTRSAAKNRHTVVQTSVAPLRSKYCKTCKARVCTFDHHCFMLGTCIGERNHARFWWFLFLTTVDICIAIVVVDNGYVYERYWWDWIAANQLAFVASIIFYLLLLIVGGLFLFHTWLACSSLTTYEMGRGSEKLDYLQGTRDFDLPFSNGIIGNLRSFCCMRDPLCVYRQWKPIRWKRPGAIDRESEDIFENCWENKYWSCC